MRGRRAVITGNPNPRAGLAETEGGSARWYAASIEQPGPEVRAPPAARLARLVFGRRTPSRRRLPRPERGAVSAEPPSAARRLLVDGVRTRERAVAGRLGAAPYAAPSTNVKTSPKSSRTSTNGFGFGFGFGDVFFSGAEPFRFLGFSPPVRAPRQTRRRVGRTEVVRRLEPVALFVVSNVAASRVFARHSSWRSSRDDDRRRPRRTRRRSSFRSKSSWRIRDETNCARMVPRRGDGDVSPRPAAGGDGDGSSRRVSVADRYRTRDGVVDDRFFGLCSCVSSGARLVWSPPGPGSNAGRDA